MRLSEAIRLGSLLKPQCFDSYYVNGGSCALGAALDAIGSSPSFEETFFPIINTLSRFCPACNCVQGWQVVVHLNDHHKWTREQIADYVESIENRGSEEQTEKNLEPNALLNNDPIFK